MTPTPSRKREHAFSCRLALLELGASVRSRGTERLGKAALMQTAFQSMLQPVLRSSRVGHALDAQTYALGL